MLDCLKWACVLIDVIRTEFQFENLLHVAIALFALQMTCTFTNHINCCNRVLFCSISNSNIINRSIVDDDAVIALTVIMICLVAIVCCDW